VRAAVYRFAAGSLLALLAVGVASVVVANSVAKDAALREARVRGAAFARDVGAPLVNGGVRGGDKVQMTRLNTVLRNRLADHSIAHMKVWDRTGRLLWADEPGLPGHVFKLEPAVQRLFGTDHILTESVSGEQAENAAERGQGQLVEVYTGVRDADGIPLVFESYWTTERFDADRHAIMTRLAPLTLGSLGLFQLAVLPLAITLARRVDRSRAQQRRMLGHALAGADLERRRIVRNLHDGLIQDLAGLGYALPMLSSRLPASKETDAARRALDELAVAVQRDVGALRTLMTDVYPTNLQQGGLADAVQQLVRSASASGLVVTTDIDTGIEESLAVTQLAYRIIREGLRNVVEHAQASHTSVIAVRDGADVVVSVSDDGKGAERFEAESGHLGLQLLEDMVHDVGGTMEVQTRRGNGTVMRATFPAHIAST